MSGHVQTVALTCHPLSPCGAHCAIEARIQREAGTLRVAYLVTGDITALRIPRTSPPQRGDRLWQHTCCELFVARAGDPGYLEFNFSPSGAWAAYAFATYRERVGDADLLPRSHATCSPQELAIEASVAMGGRLRIGVAAVIEEKTGALSYWALRHAPGKPDFHHPDAFALELDEDRA